MKRETENKIIIAKTWATFVVGWTLAVKGIFEIAHIQYAKAFVEALNEDYTKNKVNKKAVLRFIDNFPVPDILDVPESK